MTSVNGNPGQKSSTGDILQTRIANARMPISDTGANISALDYTTNLVSRYAFAGNGNDSVGANNLTANGSPTYTDGVYGQCTVLDGATQYFDGGNVLNMGTGSATFTAWVYLTSTGVFSTIVSKRNQSVSTNKGYFLGVRSNNVLYAQLCDGSAAAIELQGATALAANTWYFVTVVWNRASNMTIYLNGVSDGSTSISTQTASVDDAATNFRIGRTNGGTDYFPGRVDQAQWFSSAFSVGVVTQVYNYCHGGMISTSSVTGSGFTSDITYKRNVENTSWSELIDKASVQTITGSKTFQTGTTTFSGPTALSGTTSITTAPTIDNNIAVNQKNSGGTSRTLAYRDSSNNIQLGDATENGIIKVNEKLDFSNNVDAGLVNPLMHLYGRRIYQLANASELTNYNNGAGTTGTNALFKGAQLITSASSGNYQGYDWGGTSNDNILTRRDRKFELWFTVSFDSITSVGYEWGLVTSSGRTTLDTTAAGMSIKFDSAASANFIVRNADGVTQTSTTSSVAAAANTTYYIGIINNETNLKFYINGALIATSTTNLPTATTPLMGKIFNITNSAATKSSYTRAVLFTDDQT